MRTWSASNEAGRRTLETLDSSVRFPSLDGAKLVDVIQYLRERTGVDFVADWPELREARVKKTTLIRARWYPMAGMKMASALPPGEAGLRALLAAACREADSHAELEHVVDGEVVFISTRKGAERRMAGGGSPMPRLVPSRQDEEKQAIARLVAAREHRDPLVRRSAAWALKELR